MLLHDHGCTSAVTCVCGGAGLYDVSGSAGVCVVLVVVLVSGVCMCGGAGVCVN